MGSVSSMLRMGGRATSAVATVSCDAAYTGLSSNAANRLLSADGTTGFALIGSQRHISPKSGRDSMEIKRDASAVKARSAGSIDDPAIPSAIAETTNSRNNLFSCPRISLLQETIRLDCV